MLTLMDEDKSTNVPFEVKMLPLISVRSLCHAGHEADGASDETGPSEFP